MMKKKDIFAELMKMRLRMLRDQNVYTLSEAANNMLYDVAKALELTVQEGEMLAGDMDLFREYLKALKALKSGTRWELDGN